MLYNSTYFVHFVILALAGICLFRGLVTLRTRALQSPSGVDNLLEGRAAERVGFALIGAAVLLGVLFLVLVTAA